MVAPASVADLEKVILDRGLYVSVHFGPALRGLGYNFVVSATMAGNLRCHVIRGDDLSEMFTDLLNYIQVNGTIKDQDLIMAPLQVEDLLV